MPVMDGYAASRAIREAESTNPAQRRIPIVALTANALVGDAEACIAAGMDDHLAKPYTRKQLARVMARWLPADRVLNLPHTDWDGAGIAPTPPSTPAPEAPAAPVAAASALDTAALAHIRALDSSGDVLAEVVQMYFDEAPTHLQRLQRGLAAGDAAELARVAHAFKSASFNVGARALGETCRRLEHLGKSGSTVGAAALVAAVEAQYDQIVPLLREELGQAA